MANEITLTISLACTKLGYNHSQNESANFTQNTQGAAGGVAATSTVKSTLDIGAVATLGYILFKNLDAANACDIGFDAAGTFENFASLKAGEFCCFRPKAGITLQLKAQAGTPNIQFWLLSD